MSEKLQATIFVVVLIGIMAWVAISNMDRMEKEKAVHILFEKECIQKGGSYYTKYEKDGVGCYQVVQERITKKLY